MTDKIEDALNALREWRASNGEQGKDDWIVLNDHAWTIEAALLLRSDQRPEDAEREKALELFDRGFASVGHGVQNYSFSIKDIFEIRAALTAKTDDKIKTYEIPLELEPGKYWSNLEEHGPVKTNAPVGEK